MTVTYFTPPGEGEQRRGLMPLGLFLFFLGHLPQTPGFLSARQILAVSFATRARNCILSDLNMFYTPRGGRTTAGSNAPGAFLAFHFFGGHSPQTSDFRSAKQILVASFATQFRARILGGRNIFCTLGDGQKRRGLMPLGLFFFFFFGGHLPQTSGFRSAKQILVVSFATQARAFILSDRNICCIPGGGEEQRRGLMPLGLFLLF